MEKCWLEDDFLFEMVPFQVTFVSLPICFSTSQGLIPFYGWKMPCWIFAKRCLSVKTWSVDSCSWLKLNGKIWKNCGYVNLLIDLCVLLVICCYLLDWSFLRVFFSPGNISLNKNTICVLKDVWWEFKTSLPLGFCSLASQDMGDYGRHGVPNLVSRLWSSLQLAAEISQITDANYPATQRVHNWHKQGRQKQRSSEISKTNKLLL